MAGKAGYDYDFVKPPPDSFECPICLLTFCNPHVTSCCGNEFCQTCIEHVQREDKPCPICKEHNFTTLLHKKLVREVNALVVRCPQREAGCEWQGELGQLEQHLNPGAGVSYSSGCGYVVVECTYQCGERLQRRTVREHETVVCPKRPIELQFACLMRKFEIFAAENKLLRRELSEIKEAHEQELRELKERNEQISKDLADTKTTCDELKEKHEAVIVVSDALEKKCTSLHTHTVPLPVTPFYFTVANIFHYQENNLEFSSEPFYSHSGGYKLAVTVYPNGYHTAEGTFISLCVGLQRGEFDDQLHWPFNGRITVQVYNRTTEKWSNEKTIALNEERCGPDSVKRCLDIQNHRSWGHSTFISFSELQKHYVTNIGTTRFRVTNVELV